MKFEELAEFIHKKMKMSHIYQPVMLLSLLENHGKCHEKTIARNLLSKDQSQIEYYTAITNNMVGQVLRRHQIVEKDKSSREFRLLGFESFSPDQVNMLMELCKSRLVSFIEERGNKVYDHRRKSSGYISGTIKYEILKRARFHCELCGVSAFEKALEVDHIVPRNKGGSDCMSNFQALCYSCNAMKRDRDDTDFTKIIESYNCREPECQFCEAPSERIIDKNELAFVVRDRFPVTEHHTLIIPRRHVSLYFDLGQSEVNACTQLIFKMKTDIQRIDGSVSGFNIGINNGESSGQTIFHCHIHLIPRRKGDVENPRGGVRHVIPGKGNY